MALVIAIAALLGVTVPVLLHQWWTGALSDRGPR